MLAAANIVDEGRLFDCCKLLDRKRPRFFLLFVKEDEFSLVLAHDLLESDKDLPNVLVLAVSLVVPAFHLELCVEITSTEFAHPDFESSPYWVGIILHKLSFVH